jgi:hypothetical protein
MPGLAQVMYNAQMIRTWSLLLRNAHRHRYIVGGRNDTLTLQESPHLMHPVENHTQVGSAGRGLCSYRGQW